MSNPRTGLLDSNLNPISINNPLPVTASTTPSGFSNPSYDKILMAKDGSYVKFYKDEVLVKQLTFSSTVNDDVIEEVDV